jgi:hypothetical protein
MNRVSCASDWGGALVVVVVVVVVLGVEVVLLDGLELDELVFDGDGVWVFGGAVTVVV